MTDRNGSQSIQKLTEIMALLRSSQGCSWDRQQTPETLKKHILEEAYEVMEAIDGGNPEDICDELGDLLLQVVFLAQIFAEAGQFTLHDVAQSISNKLKRRHPHIFSDASHEGHEQRWEDIKRQERFARGQSNSLQKRLPNTLPALKRATKAVKKCSQYDPLYALREVETELQRIKNCCSANEYPQAETSESIGQILLNICKFSAATGFEPEDILRKKTSLLITEIDSENGV